MTVRCAWVGNDPLLIAYHDTEWGVPVHGDHLLFEFLVLEGMQAGLNWMTILRKRENFRRAFDGFDPRKIAQYTEDKLVGLMSDAGIVRNRKKIEAVVQNAAAFLDIQRQFGSFDAYIWGFVDGRPIQNAWKTLSEIPAQTELSQRLSKDMVKHGFRFVGPTIVYAHMQATGMVNDHTVDCFRYPQLSKLND